MISGLCLLGCGEASDSSANEAESAGSEPLLTTLAPDDWNGARASFSGSDGNTIGQAVVADTPTGGVLIRIDLEGLSPGWHGIHLHQVGDCSDAAEGFKLSGGHVDPDDREHGLLNPQGPEAADLPNIYAGADGRATGAFYNDRVALQGGDDALMDDDSFAIIVHINPDDHMTQPIGGAGDRVACAAFGSPP